MNVLIALFCLLGVYIIFSCGVWYQQHKERQEKERHAANRQRQKQQRQRKQQYMASDNHCAKCMTHLKDCRHVQSTYRKAREPRCYDCGDPDLMFTKNGSVYWREDRWLCEVCESDEELKKIPPEYNPFSRPSTYTEPSIEELFEELVELTLN